MYCLPNIVCCVCDPIVHLNFLPYFYVCLCMSEFISSFWSLRAGSQAFALLMLFLCVIYHYMWPGKSMQLICILPFGILCLSSISMMFVKIILAVCMLVDIVV